MDKFKDNIKISLIDKKISSSEIDDIIELIKKENALSILSNLSNRLIREYIDLALQSDNIFLTSLSIENRIRGHALFTKNAKFLINDFKKLRFKIFFNLLGRFKIFSLINIILDLSKIHGIFIKKKDKVLIQESLYLNLIAVHKDFQSKGIGRNFFDHSVKLIYENNFKFEYISCESHKAALDFYLNKVNFRLVGKKMRIFRNWYVLLKKY